MEFQGVPEKFALNLFEGCLRVRALRCVLTPGEVVREGQNLTQREALTHPSNKFKLKYFLGALSVNKE